MTTVALASRPSRITPTPRHLVHKTPRTASALPDHHEPLDALENGVAVETLAMIDAAIDAGDVTRARQLENLLPQTLGAEPAVVDRLATLRLLEGDVDTAAAALGACPRSTPRLDLLRAIVALRRNDLLTAYAIATGPSSRRSLCLRTLAAVVSSLTVRTDEKDLDRGRLHVVLGSDPTAAVCAATRDYLEAAPGSGPGCLIPALKALRLLLPVALPGTFPAAIRHAIASVALDLGVPLDAPPEALCVTPLDTSRLHLRAA